MGVPQALSHKKNLPPPFSLPEKKKEKKGTRRYLPRSDERRRDTFFVETFFPHIRSAVQFAFWAAEMMGKQESFFRIPRYNMQVFVDEEARNKRRKAIH